MRPYYQHAGITIYHGDCREILPQISGCDTVLTDPVWPNSSKELTGWDRPMELFGEMCRAIPQDAGRLIVHLGCDSDPRFLQVVPAHLRFLRVCWLRYACATRKGRLLYGADVAYVYGSFPKSAPGRRVISGEFLGETVSTRPDVRRMRVAQHREWGVPVPGEHPTPRRLQHLRWLVAKWCEGLIVDPFCGSGTTLVAAAVNNLPAVGIEIEERWCEVAANRLSQGVLLVDEVES